MIRHLGLPSGYMTTTLLVRIQQFNRYLPYSPYLSGTGNNFDADDVREMVCNALPMYIHTIIATSNHKWYDKNKSDAKVCAYFDCLLVISALMQGEKRELKSTSKKQVTYTSKKNSFNKNLLNTNHLPKTRPKVSSASSVM
jgi:hydroxylamine reductase (hybrid-cluster protein)